MKKHLLRIIAAALAVALILALPGCSLLVPVTGEYSILSVNDIGVNRFFAEGSAEGAAFIESLGFGEETGFDGPANEIMTIGLESGGTGYVTKLGFITYALAKLISGKISEAKPAVLVLALLFAGKFAVG